MNTYDDRTRLILSEIGMMTVELISLDSKVYWHGIVDGLVVKADNEQNPAKKAILNDAITMVENSA
ncbi:hypothetical protein [Providencia sp.]|uniref:hypothetical protein n=1 Tax=Providencia sp. TaxID=589 RepID=UPI003F95ABE1